MAIRKRTITGVLTSSALLALAFASPAHADGSVKTLKWGDYKAGAGRALFKSSGDRLTVIDYVDDGRSVSVSLGGRDFSYYDPDGPSGREFNLDFPEGKKLTLGICLKHGDHYEDGTCTRTTVTA